MFGHKRDQREVHKATVFYSLTSFFSGECSVWVYIPNPAYCDEASEDFPICQTYLDVVRNDTASHCFPLCVCLLTDCERERERVRVRVFAYLFGCLLVWRPCPLVGLVLLLLILFMHLFMHLFFLLAR